MPTGAMEKVPGGLAAENLTSIVRVRGNAFRPPELKPNWADVRALSARIALFGDSASTPLTDWIGHTFPSHSICHISESYIADVSPRNSSFDLLVVAGREVRRVRQILKFYGPALNCVPKIAMLHVTMPKERAALLNSGFDDVFELRMKVPEARARAIALVNRYAIAADLQPSLVLMPHLSLFRKAAPHMTPRERSIGELLFKRYPDPVSFSELTSAMPGKAPLGTSSLRVLISKLRLKLPSNVRINHHSSIAYSLEID